MSLLRVEAWVGFLTEARADRGLLMELVREAVGLLAVVVVAVGAEGMEDLEGVRLTPDGEEEVEERWPWPGGEGFLTVVDMADVGYGEQCRAHKNDGVGLAAAKDSGCGCLRLCSAGDWRAQRSYSSGRAAGGVEAA